MAEIKAKTHGKPTKERREDALERLLLLAVTLLPDDDDSGMIADVAGEAAFWLDLQPRGARVVADSPELRLGYKDVQARRARWAPELDADGALVEVKKHENGAATHVPAKAAGK